MLLAGPGSGRVVNSSDVRGVGGATECYFLKWATAIGICPFFFSFTLSLLQLPVTKFTSNFKFIYN